MADAQLGEGRQFNLHSAGTDLVEGSALAVKGGSGAITVDGFTETGSSALVALAVTGGTPHDSVDSGNPIKTGGKASSTTPTAVAAADRVNAWYGINGQLVVSILGATANFNGSDAVGQAGLPGADGSYATYPLGAAGYVNSGTSWDKMRSITGLDNAPNVDTGILAVGTGPGWDRKRDPAGVAATSTANAVTVVVDGASTVTFHVTTIGTTPGSMIIETTTDDSAWATADFVLQTNTTIDTRIEGSFVPAVNDRYVCRTVGVRQIRYRVNAVYASGTATVKVTSSTGTSMLEGVHNAPAPHAFGYASLSATAQYTTTQTSTTLGPTVSSTQRMVVTSVQIQAGGTTAGELQVYFGTGAYSRGTSKAIFDGEFAPSATSKPGFGLAPAIPWIGAADEELKVTDSAAINKLTCTVWYYLVTA